MTRLTTDPRRCVACRACQLWCSFSHGALTHPSRARLDIQQPPDTDVHFHPDCDECGMCARVCPTGAIESAPEARGEDS